MDFFFFCPLKAFTFPVLFKEASRMTDCVLYTQIIPDSVTVTNSNTGRVNLLEILQRVRTHQRGSSVKAGPGGEGGRKNQINSEAGWQTLCPFVTLYRVRNKKPV